jgi:hypothetical protein
MNYDAADLRPLHGRAEGENQFVPQQTTYWPCNLSISTFPHTVNAPLSRAVVAGLSDIF